jgi:hypothetical protein
MNFQKKMRLFFESEEALKSFATKRYPLRFPLTPKDLAEIRAIVEVAVPHW